MRAGELQDLAQRGYMGDALELLLEVYSAQELLTVLQPLVRATLSASAPDSAEKGSWQQVRSLAIVYRQCIT